MSSPGTKPLSVSMTTRRRPSAIASQFGWQEWFSQRALFPPMLLLEEAV
jgi:hypothetical protein